MVSLLRRVKMRPLTPLISLVQKVTGDGLFQLLPVSQRISYCVPCVLEPLACMCSTYSPCLGLHPPSAPIFFSSSDYQDHARKRSVDELQKVKVERSLAVSKLMLLHGGCKGSAG